LPFGVELEVDSKSGEKAITQEQIKDIICRESKRSVSISDWAQTYDNDYWHVKYDSTCGTKGKGKDSGWEVASFVAKGYKDLAHIGKVADTLDRSGIPVNQNCGLHVHVDASTFEKEDVAVLVARWLKIEHWIKQILPAHRKSCKYCKSLSTFYKKKLFGVSKADSSSFWEIIKPTNLNIHENSQKKVAINLVNYTLAVTPKYESHVNKSRRTIEFRIAEGTLDGTTIKQWVRLFLLFAQQSKQSKMPEDFIGEESINSFLRYFRLEGEGEFFLLSPTMYDLKIWLLKRITAFGSAKYCKKAEEKLEAIEA